MSDSLAAPAGTILVASTISVEIGLSVALIELVGVIVGNAFDLVPSWLAFIGTFAGVVLTFQAGAEVDVPQFKREWQASLSIGLVSFFAPFAASLGLAYYGLGWNRRGRDRRARALDDEPRRRLRRARRDGPEPRAGRQAAHVGDLRHRHRHRRRPHLLFVKPTIWIVPFARVSLALIVGLPRVAPWFFGRYGDRVIEPEIKLVFACSC